MVRYGPARAVNTVQGINDNLLGINEFVKVECIIFFDGEEVNVYDLKNTKVKVS